MAVITDITALPTISPSPATTAGPDELTNLVSAALRGDRPAWSELVKRFDPLIDCVIRKYRLGESDTADVRQVIWLKMVKHLKDLRDPRALPGWITTTTKHEVLNMIAVSRHFDPAEPMFDSRHYPQVDGPQPIDAVLRAERHQAVHQALSTLNSPNRELLELLSDPDVSYREISRRLNIPIGSIGPTRARCLRKLAATPTVRALAS